MWRHAQAGLGEAGAHFAPRRSLGRQPCVCVRVAVCFLQTFDPFFKMASQPGACGERQPARRASP